MKEKISKKIGIWQVILGSLVVLYGLPSFIIGLAKSINLDDLVFVVIGAGLILSAISNLKK